MKKINYSNQYVKFLLTGFLLISSCRSGDDLVLLPGVVQFTGNGIGAVAAGRKAELNDVELGWVTVSIAGEDELPLITLTDLKLFLINGDYISEVLELGAGEYSITDYLLKDIGGQVVYVAPKEGSLLAGVVNEPLPLRFEVSSNSITTVWPEVVSVEAFLPSDFGYTIFDVNEVETFTAVVTVFERIAGELQAAAAHLEINSGEGEAWSHSEDIENGVAIAKLPSGHEKYFLSVTKPGYEPVEKIFTEEELDAGKSFILIPETIEIIVPVSDEEPAHATIELVNNESQEHIEIPMTIEGQAAIVSVALPSGAWEIEVLYYYPEGLADQSGTVTRLVERGTASVDVPLSNPPVNEIVFNGPQAGGEMTWEGLVQQAKDAGTILFVNDPCLVHTEVSIDAGCVAELTNIQRSVYSEEGLLDSVVGEIEDHNYCNAGGVVFNLDEMNTTFAEFCGGEDVVAVDQLVYLLLDDGSEVYFLHIWPN